MKNIEYYQDNDMIRTNFDFLKLVIDNWHLNVNKLLHKKNELFYEGCAEKYIALFFVLRVIVFLSLQF